MKQLVLIACLLACWPVLGANVQADVYIDFEHGTSGDILTTTDVIPQGRYASRITSITVPALTTLAVSATGESVLPFSFQSGETTFTDSGTRGIAWTNTANLQYVQLGFDTGYNDISCGFRFRMSDVPHDDGGGNYSYTEFLGGGGYCLHAFVDGPSNARWVCETVNNDGAAITPSTNWVWVSLVYHRNGVGYIRMFDAAGQFIGGSTNTTGDHAMIALRVGREDAHPSPANFNFTCFMDDLAINFDGTPIEPPIYDEPQAVSVGTIQTLRATNARIMR